MSKATIIFLSIAGFFVLAGLWLVGNYNSLVKSGTQVDKSWSMVETQYQRRLDLIENLVETVKGAQGQEQKVFKDIADARSAYAGSKSSSEQAAAAGNVESALSRLLVITEAYPELKSNENVKSLQADLGKTEDSIAKARDQYNTTASNYNLNIRRFPKNIFAKLFGFDPRSLFKSDVGSEKAPKVKF
jgi:LemA protein